jgi:hypothetical protein
MFVNVRIDDKILVLSIYYIHTPQERTTRFVLLYCQYIELINIHGRISTIPCILGTKFILISNLSICLSNRL